MSVTLSFRAVSYRASLLLAWAWLLSASPSQAQQVLYQTGFESPNFLTGQPVTGQQNWIAGEFNDASPAAGVISTTHPNSGQQGLQVNGAALDFVAADNQYEGVYRPDTDFDLSHYTKVWVQADVRLDGPGTTPPISGDLYSANLNVYNHTDDVAEMWFSSDGHIYSYGDGQAYQFAQPVTLGNYVTLGILLDFANKTNGYYVNGVLVGSLAMPTSIAVHPLVVFNLTDFGVADFGSYSHSDYTGYFDNVRVISVPEPGSVALLIGMSLSGAGFLARRRKNARQAA